VHSPLTPETIHQIGTRELALMKPNAYLINTARGAIVDAAALARALKKRQLAGAGLDVFEHEPKVTPSLLKLPNVVTTRIWQRSREVREQMANIVVDNILAFLAGRYRPIASILKSCEADDALSREWPMPRPLIAVTDSPFPSLDPAKAALARIDPELRIAKSPSADDVLARRATPTPSSSPMPSCRRAVAAAEALQGDRPIRPWRRQHRHSGRA